LRTPPQIKRDPKQMRKISEEDKERERKAKEVILPKINKRAQNRQRIIGNNKMKNQEVSSRKVNSDLINDLVAMGSQRKNKTFSY